MHDNEYRLSQLAKEQLLNIKRYTVENFSESQWAEYKKILMKGFQLLANNPGLGLGCDEIYKDGFYFPVGKHTAYFTKHDEFILIVAVLGQGQLPRNHLN